MKRGKIIIIEGTSCVGKTTLCSILKKEGWKIIPEAIRYLEQETHKKGDEASPIPNAQEEEEYYQRELFRIELQKLEEANAWCNQGYNVVLDKSAIATIATAKAFEESKGFVGTYDSACNKYLQLLITLNERGLIECDGFLLLTADYDIITKRNMTRNHRLEGVWLDEKTINSQRQVLEHFANNIIGKGSANSIATKVIDTSSITPQELLQFFLKFAESIELESTSREEESGDDRSAHTHIIQTARGTSKRYLRMLKKTE